MKRKIFTVAIAVAAVLFVIFIWWRADEGGLPVFISALYTFPYGDKVGHFLLMGVLTFLVCLPFCLYERTPRSLSGAEATKSGKKRPSRNRLWIVIAIIALVITLEEISQHFFASRTMDVADLLCSYAGIAAFGGMVLWLCREKM